MLYNLVLHHTYDSTGEVETVHIGVFYGIRIVHTSTVRKGQSVRRSTPTCSSFDHATDGIWLHMTSFALT